jgi:hypothetical protein
LNEATEEFDWPLPRLQDMRHWVQGFTWFASIDLKEAFHRLTTYPESRKWFCYSTPWGLYQIQKMTFGLRNAPSYFQRYLDHLLQQCGIWARWYQDDILIAGHTKRQVEHRLRIITKILIQDGNQIQWEKSEPPTQRIKWCGLIFTPQGIEPGDTFKPDAPYPTNKKDRQSALGWINYFRDHIPWLSQYIGELYPDKNNKLTTQDPQARWKEAMVACRDAIKLSHWTSGGEADLIGDASNYAMGGMLIKNGKVVAVWSKKLSPAQTRYSATDREHLALATSAYKFRIFLDDHSVQTNVYTDHMSLLNRDWTDLRPIQVRWCLTIQRYIARLHHKPGIENPADFLSRQGSKGGG